MSNRIS